VETIETLVAAHVALLSDAAGRHVTLTSTAGDIRVTEISAGTMAGTLGSVTLISAGRVLKGAGTITADTLTVIADGDVGLNTAVASLDVATAGSLTVVESNALQMTTNVGSLSLTTTAAGDVAVTEQNDIVLGSILLADGDLWVIDGNLWIAETVTANNVTFESGGSLLMAEDARIVAGTLRVTAAGAVTLYTRVDEITVESTGAGEIALTEDDAIILNSVSTANGPITVTAGGTITAVVVESQADSDDNDIS
jgi:hypothetical protein